MFLTFFRSLHLSHNLRISYVTHGRDPQWHFPNGSYTACHYCTEACGHYFSTIVLFEQCSKFPRNCCLEGPRDGRVFQSVQVKSVSGVFGGALWFSSALTWNLRSPDYDHFLYPHLGMSLSLLSWSQIEISFGPGYTWSNCGWFHLVHARSSTRTPCVYQVYLPTSCHYH